MKDIIADIYNYYNYFILHVKIPIRLAVIAKIAIAAESYYWHTYTKGVEKKSQQGGLLLHRKQEATKNTLMLKLLLAASNEFSQQEDLK